MIAKNCLTGSGFYSISEAPKILLLQFWFLYFQFLFLEIFLIPLLFACFSFEKIFPFTSLSSHNFWFFVLQMLQWPGGVVFLSGNFPGCEIFATCGISQDAKFCNLQNFASCTVHLPAPFIFRLLQTLRFLNPPFFFPNKPLNRHLRPLIGQVLSFSPLPI